MGGAERVARNLCKGLVDYGYEVDLVLVEAMGELLDDLPDAVSVIDLNASRVLRSLGPLREYLSTREPDILYSMMTEPNVIAVLAHRLAASDSRLVVSEHNMLSHSSESVKDQLARSGAWALYPLADDVVAVSEGVRDDLVANTRLDSTDISVIYNPVDVESIRELATQPVYHRWFSDDSLDVVLAGGRHEPQKGFDTLLKAFSRISEEDVRLVLFGTGPETESLQAHAAALEIDDHVSFPGFVENPFVFMASADVFVLSSEYEGFGLVLIEALACGCPVVSTDCESGPAEILEGGTYGPLVPVGDENALAEAIGATLADAPDPDTLRGRADDFDIESSIDQYDSLFHSSAI
ncbi:glycosyltransferase [Halorhabdus sp. CBA1104]|uniref:glycosyltransferase n=1 Tax=Halorhabdus sp. CBA1104 TaxID=1380432 RepID=UPI001E447E6E|nr:glycosyltransferase [Halorhabdus sp. CBA1104]